MDVAVPTTWSLVTMSPWLEDDARAQVLAALDQDDRRADVLDGREVLLLQLVAAVESPLAVPVLGAGEGPEWLQEARRRTTNSIKPGRISQYGNAGKLQPVDPAAQQEVKANFSPEWAKLATVNGKLYGVPVDASDKSTVWYNDKLFLAAGITSLPKTWTQFSSDAQTLRNSGVTVPIAVGGGDG